MESAGTYVKRLPWYLAFVKLMKGKGETFISSTQIAKEINVDPSQVAKDLSFVNISGRREWDTILTHWLTYWRISSVLHPSIRHFCFGVGSWALLCCMTRTESIWIGDRGGL